jgi:iron(III) transport system permease protein
VLLLFVLALVVLERWSRKQGRVASNATVRYKQLPRYDLNLAQRSLVVLTCALPITLGFLLPAGLLTSMAIRNRSTALATNIWRFAGNSLLLASITAVLALIVALVLAYGLRLYPSRVSKAAARVAALGYAVPGSVIAVGVLMAFGWFDNSLDSWLRTTFGVSSGLLLSGTLVGLVFACMVRFLAVSLGMVEASLSSITPNMDDAAQSLGHRSISRLWRVHMPLMRGSLLTALLLVFVDVIKELPITIIVRPFNFETLATRVYRLASDERLAASSGLALMIVIVGIIPVIVLSRAITQSRKQT